MNGLLHHLLLTLRLNFRSKQALVYGYIVPIFFLLAFGSVFRSSVPPLVQEMGQLLTITVLGGACFGMPTAMVAERERGVWRRYRLLPTATNGLILSAMVGRFVIILTAVILQLGLAWCIYRTPMPAHPLQLFIAFAFVCFAFLGVGLMVAMLAANVPAVQALGQAIFLPMIMIGGVGIPLRQFKGSASWVPHVASFLPGKYAVEAFDSCVQVNGGGLYAARFALMALFVIGIAAIFAGAKLFRWDVGQRLARGAKGWVAVALVAWAAVGLAAETTGRLTSSVDKPVQIVSDTSRKEKKSPAMKTATKPSTQPAATADATVALVANNATVALFTTNASIAMVTTNASVAVATTNPAVAVATTRPAQPPTTVAIAPPATRAVAATAPATMPAVAAADRWKLVTDKDLNDITYDDVPPDQGTVVPLAQNLDNLDDEGKKRIEGIQDKLADWKPAQEENIFQRVLNLLCVAAIADVAQDQFEAEIPYVVFDQLRRDVPEAELKKAVGYIILHPDEGTVFTNVKELGIEGDVVEEGVRERTPLYAKKLLFRLLGKDQK